MSFDLTKMNDINAIHAVWNADFSYQEEANEYERQLNALLSEVDTPQYVLLARGLDEEQKAQIEAWDVPGALLEPRFARRYNYGPTAAHVLGHVSSDGTGLAGVEAAPVPLLLDVDLWLAALIGATLVMALIFLVVFGLLFGCFIGILVAMSAGAGQSESGSIFLAVFMVLGIIGMFLLTVLITAFFIVRLMFFPQMVVLEGRGPLEALSRSWQLVRGSFWRVLGTVILISLLVQILIIIPGLIFGGIIGFVFSDPQDFAIQQSLSTLVGYIAQILFLPVSIIAYTLLYYDLRVRKEGYDLQLLAQDYAPGSAQ